MPVRPTRIWRMCQRAARSGRSNSWRSDRGLGLGSKVRLVRLRNRHHVIIEIADIVLGADHFNHAAIIDAPVTLNGAPWRRERAGVLDMDLHVDGLAAVDQLESLDHV